MSTVTVPNASPEAERNWQRYQYALQRGHRTYVERARRCEGFYLGGGLHWTGADRARLAETGNRPAYELNEIMPAVNAAVGYQIHNRLDIQFLPRGGMADATRAQVRSKVAMQVCDRTHFHWKETQVFSDGAIEQRGYFDIRMNFDTNVFGDIDVDTLDPRDTIPDPDAKDYSPFKWADVTITRWLTLDEIEQRYGKEARANVSRYLDEEGDWGETDSDGERNKFGTDGIASSRGYDYTMTDEAVRRYRVLDRQFWKYQLSDVLIWPTGDVKSIAGATEEQIAQYMTDGAVRSKRMQRVVRWEVTTRFATLFAEDSPYDRFTIIPFFFYFRRGQTRGMVDNAISPQEVLNKAASQMVHILNTAANSGWTVEEESLVNMEPADLEDEGGKSGLVVIFKKGSQRPEKIDPNPIPQGMDRLIDRAREALRNVTVTDELRGQDSSDTSGVMTQSKQFAAQNQLAIPLDNLSRTRHLVAEHLHYLMSTYMDNEREFRIAEVDPRTGQEVTNVYRVNVYNPATRTWDNDLTEGDYDVVASEAPMQITFENSQFQQALDMRKLGVAVPDNVVVKHSNLVDKAEILSQMQAQPTQADPLTQAKAALADAQAAVAKAQADKLQAETANTRITSQFGAVQTAQVIATMPAVAPLADALAKSAGVVDQDAPPNIPALPAPSTSAPPAPAAAPVGPGGAGGAGVHENTSPQFPAKPVNPAVGIDQGIEGGGDAG